MTRRTIFIVGAVFLIALLIRVWGLRSTPELNAHVIILDPTKVELRPVLLDIKATQRLSFSQIVAPMHPYAAINGTFYDGNFRPLGDVLIDRKLVINGQYANAVAVTNYGKVRFVRRSGPAFDWRGYRCALAAGPRLVHKGEALPAPAEDGFVLLDPNAKASRSGIGITRSGKVLLVVCETHVTMWRFARLMRDLGAVEALNLDGGPASGLYCNGKTIVEARLRMTNLLVAYKRR